MSFDKNYPTRKDKRKPFYGAKAVDQSCRNNGSCSYCRGNRTVKRSVIEQAANEEIKMLSNAN